MHDIKYFFLNKINQTIQRGQQIFAGRANYQKYYRKVLFSKFRRWQLPLLAHAASAPVGRDV
jgi:hypothetical protein